MRFCQSESDFITFFDVYKEWAEVPKQSKNKWCVINCINARSMRSAQDLVNEIINILDKELHMKITSKFTNEKIHNELLKIIFYSFYQNLCIYSGHPKFGYKSLNVPDTLLIHPSSSLYTYGSWRPNFLVYDSVLRTDKNYLINVSPVSEDLMFELQSTSLIDLKLSSLTAFQLQMYSNSPIGKIIILRDIIGKKGIQKKNLESRIKNLVGNEQVVIDVDIPKGEIKTYASQNKEELIQSIIFPLISTAKEKLLAEEKEVYIDSCLCAILSAGIKIKDVILPGECRDLKVVLKDNTDLESVVAKLQACGKIINTHKTKTYLKITFDKPIFSKNIFKLFQNEESFSLYKFFKTNNFDLKANQYKIFISFIRRKCTGIAFVSVDPPTAALSIISRFLFRSLQYKGTNLVLKLSKKSQDIRISGLPSDTDYHDFREFLSSKIEEDCKITKLVVLKEAEFESTDLIIESIKQRLFNLFVQFTFREKLSIDVKKVAPKAAKWHADIYFENCHDGEAAVNVLKNRVGIPDIIGLTMKPFLQTFLYCKPEIFSTINPQIKEALEFFKNNSVPGNTLDINATTKNDNIQIHIKSNNVSDIMDARKAILNILMGDQICCKGNESLERLFSRTGQEFLKETASKESGCYLDLNIYKKVVTLFGNETVCSLIKTKINEFLDKLEGENFSEIHLLTDNGKPGVLKTLLKNYGHDLSKFKEFCGVTDIEINTRNHVLHVKGSNASISKCQAVIIELKDKLKDVQYKEDAECCPICFIEIADECHRLEYCGHAYCKECILLFFQNSDNFPLCCISCEALIVLADLNWACKEENLSETDLLKRSFQDFTQKREDICYCPSPDCPMFFRKSSEENVFQCSSCRNAICTKCEVIYHYGMSCSLYQISKKTASADVTFQAWMKDNPDNRKFCSHCSSPIEKNGGCNHMTCWKCKSHLCWLCLQVFPSSDHYDLHQPRCPKRKP